MNRKNLHALSTLSIIGLLALSAPVSASLIAYEGFDYALDGFAAGLEGDNGGSGWSAGWADLAGSDVRNGVFGPSLTVSSDIAPAAIGNEAHVQLATAGNGIARLLPSTIGDDGTTAWLSFRTQNNNISASEAFGTFFTVSGGTDRSVLIGATGGTGGQSGTDGQFDLAYQPGGQNADIASRDTGNHFVVVRFNFGAGDSDTVTAFWDPTSTTDFNGAGDAQISGFDASFNGIGMTGTGVTPRYDEFILGTTINDVTNLVAGPLMFVADANNGSHTLVRADDGSPAWDNIANPASPNANWYVDDNGDRTFENSGNNTATQAYSTTITDGLVLEFVVESFGLDINDVFEIAGFDIVNQNGSTAVDGGLVADGSSLNFFDSDGQEWRISGVWAANGAGDDYVFNLGVHGSPQGSADDHLFTLTFTAIPTPAALPAGLAMLALAAMRRKRRAS